MNDIDTLIAQIPEDQRGRLAIWYNTMKKQPHDRITLGLTIQTIIGRGIWDWGYWNRLYEGIHHQRQLERHKELKKQEPMNIGAILAKLAEGEK